MKREGLNKINKVVSEEYDSLVEEDKLEEIEQQEELSLEDLSKEELIDVINGLVEENSPTTEEQLDLLNIAREKIRESHEDNPEFWSAERLKSIYQDPRANTLRRAHELATAYQLFVKVGIDVSTASALANSIIQSQYSLEIAKEQDSKQI